MLGSCGYSSQGLRVNFTFFSLESGHDFVYITKGGFKELPTAANTFTGELQSFNSSTGVCIELARMCRLPLAHMLASLPAYLAEVARPHQSVIASQFACVPCLASSLLLFT
jgi:hypothetical protein